VTVTTPIPLPRIAARSYRSVAGVVNRVPARRLSVPSEQPERAENQCAERDAGVESLRSRCRRVVPAASRAGHARWAAGPHANVVDDAATLIELRDAVARPSLRTRTAAGGDAPGGSSVTPACKGEAACRSPIPYFAHCACARVIAVAMCSSASAASWNAARRADRRLAQRSCVSTLLSLRRGDCYEEQLGIEWSR